MAEDQEDENPDNLPIPSPLVERVEQLQEEVNQEATRLAKAEAAYREFMAAFEPFSAQYKRLKAELQVEAKRAEEDAQRSVQNRSASAQEASTLFKEIAKRSHPDKFQDPTDKARGAELLKLAEEAKQAKDMTRLQEMLEEALSRGPADELLLQARELEALLKHTQTLRIGHEQRLAEAEGTPEAELYKVARHLRETQGVDYLDVLREEHRAALAKPGRGKG